MLPLLCSNGSTLSFSKPHFSGHRLWGSLFDVSVRLKPRITLLHLSSFRRLCIPIRPVIRKSQPSTNAWLRPTPGGMAGFPQRHPAQAYRRSSLQHASLLLRATLQAARRVPGHQNTLARHKVRRHALSARRPGETDHPVFAVSDPPASRVWCFECITDRVGGSFSSFKQTSGFTSASSASSSASSGSLCVCYGHCGDGTSHTPSDRSLPSSALVARTRQTKSASLL